MNRIEFEKFLNDNKLSIKLKENYKTDSETAYTYEGYYDGKCIFDCNEFYISNRNKINLLGADPIDVIELLKQTEWIYEMFLSCEVSDIVGENFKFIRRANNKSFIPVDTLKDNIRFMGFPNSIIIYKSGFLVNIKPEKLEPYEFGLEFISDEDTVRISNLGDIKLEKTFRPDNIIVDCKLCYRILNKYDDCLGYIYWGNDN